MFQNLTGVNAINYYSPRIFQSIGIVGTNAGLFGTGIYGIVKLVVTFLWSIFLIDHVGRKRLIIYGSAGAICTCPFYNVRPRAARNFFESSWLTFAACFYSLFVLYWGLYPDQHPWRSSHCDQPQCQDHLGRYLSRRVHLHLCHLLLRLMEWYLMGVHRRDLPQPRPYTQCFAISCEPVVVAVCRCEEHTVHA